MGFLSSVLQSGSLLASATASAICRTSASYGSDGRESCNSCNCFMMAAIELRVVGIKQGTGIGSGSGIGTGVGMLNIAIGTGTNIGTGTGTMFFGPLPPALTQVSASSSVCVDFVILIGLHDVAFVIMIGLHIRDLFCSSFGVVDDDCCTDPLVAGVFFNIPDDGVPTLMLDGIGAFGLMMIGV